MRYQLGPAFRVTLFMTILTGLIYPGIVTGFCQMLFPKRANGSLVIVDGKISGSALIGQNFAKPEYFHPRPSAGLRSSKCHSPPPPSRPGRARENRRIRRA